MLHTTKILLVVFSSSSIQGSQYSKLVLNMVRIERSISSSLKCAATGYLVGLISEILSHVSLQLNVLDLRGIPFFSVKSKQL